MADDWKNRLADGGAGRFAQPRLLEPEMEFQLEEPGDVPFVWNAADRVRQEQKVRERYPDAFAARYYFNMNHDPVGLMEADRHGYDRMSDAELETQGVYRRSENRPRNMSGISLTPIPINDLARRR